MSVLNYTIKANINGIYNFLNELKNFAVAQGWTADIHKQGFTWAWTGSNYDWVADSEHFLALSSSGYGSQDLQVRIRAYATGADPDAEVLEIRGMSGGTKGVDNAFPDHPVLRASATNLYFNTYGWNSLPTAPIPQTWFFGNDKFIMAVNKVDSSFVSAFFFGSVELFAPTGETQGMMIGHPMSNQTWKWYDHHEFCPFDTIQNGYVYYRSTRFLATALQGWNFYMNTSNTHANNKFGSFGRIIRENQYSEVRPITKQIMYMQDDADSVWFPLGTSWVYRFFHKDLLIGEVVEMGTNKYITFPNGRLNERFCGMAVQIA